MSPGVKRRSFFEHQAIKHRSIYIPARFEIINPPADICFLTVADFRFFRGIEGFLLSLLEVYPGLAVDVFILHDGTLSRFLRNRLLSLYSKCIFLEPKPGWLGALASDSLNRKRIGYLGYLNTFALSLSGYRRVIVLDSDILVLGSLHLLWASGDAFRLAPDCGTRSWSPVSTVTGRPVLNSGVISVPGWALSEAEQRRIADLIVHSSIPACPLLDRFADQKVWNQYLSSCEVDILPVNQNCNVKYWDGFLGGLTLGLSVLHFAGPKPWLTWPWLDPASASAFSSARLDQPWFARASQFWNQHYCRLLAAWRLSIFRSYLDADDDLPRSGEALIVQSLEFILDSDEGFESVHLLVPDLEAFGGALAESVAWPAEWLAQAHALGVLHVWFPFELSSFFDHCTIPSVFRLHWLLIEAPFSPELDPSVGPAVVSDDYLCFEPWSSDPVRSMAIAVQHRLRAVGCRPLLRGLELSYTDSIGMC